MSSELYVIRERCDRLFELRHQVVELIDDGPDGFRLAQVDAGALQQRHRVIAAARLEQREVAIDRGGALRLGRRSVSCFISCALDAKQVAY